MSYLSSWTATFASQSYETNATTLLGNNAYLSERRSQAPIAPGEFCPYVHMQWYRQLIYASKAGFLAQKRLARGLQLNQTEATALIACQLQERIRDGKNSVAELMQHGKAMLGRRHVLPGVSALLHEIQVEGSFPDGYVPDVPCMFAPLIPPRRWNARRMTSESSW